MSRLKPGFAEWHAKQTCIDCELWMEHVSKDGCYVSCPNCWTPLPIPVEFRYWGQRIAMSKA